MHFSLAAVFEDDNWIWGDCVGQEKALDIDPSVATTTEIHPHGESFGI